MGVADYAEAVSVEPALTPPHGQPSLAPNGSGKIMAGNRKAGDLGEKEVVRLEGMNLQGRGSA